MSRCKTNLVHGLRVLLILSFAISLTTVASAQCWYVNLANGHWYRLTADLYYGAHDEPNPHTLTPDWFDAEAEAQSYGEGAHLVTVNDAAENQWLVDTFGPDHHWIGFTDHSACSDSGEGNWVWVSGEAATYTNWDSGQPDNYRQGEDVAHINHGSHVGRWNDLGNDNTHGAGTTTPFAGIVEMPAPDTSSVWNIYQDFSPVQGARNWRYGFTEDGGAFTEMTEPPGVGMPDCWTVDYSEPEPWYWTRICRPSSPPHVIMAPNALIGNNERTPANQEAVLRWTSPIQGPITVSGHVQKGWQGGGGDGVDWHVKHNGTVVFSYYVAPTDTVGTTFVLDALAEQGDVIDFVLNNHGVGGADGVQCGVTIDASTLTGVPRESAGGALLSGMIVSPNPTRAGAMIRFSLPKSGVVRVSIYDVAGRVVSTVFEGQRPGGDHVLRWDGTSTSGQQVVPGVYFVRAESVGGANTSKIVRIR